MKLDSDSQGWALALTLLVVPGFAHAADDDQDDNNSPGVGDAIDALQNVHDAAEHLGSGHGGHVPAATDAEAERFVVHGGMSWEELARTHHQARAAGSAVSFGEASGHAPNPFQI